MLKIEPFFRLFI